VVLAVAVAITGERVKGSEQGFLTVLGQSGQFQRRVEDRLQVIKHLSGRPAAPQFGPDQSVDLSERSVRKEGRS
jgi:hypothetical protein